MKVLKICVLFILIVFGAGIAGCGGGGAELKSHTTTTTMGQELLDLEAAYKKGVITKDEYERSKEKVLDRKYN